MWCGHGPTKSTNSSNPVKRNQLHRTRCAVEVKAVALLFFFHFCVTSVSGMCLILLKKKMNIVWYHAYKHSADSSCTFLSFDLRLFVIFPVPESSNYQNDQLIVSSFVFVCCKTLWILVRRNWAVLVSHVFTCYVISVIHSELRIRIIFLVLGYCI